MQVEPKLISRLEDCILNTILTVMTSQMAILFKRAILKHYQTFFHNPCISWDAARSNFMATTPMPVEPNMIFHLQDCIFHYFDHYDVTNGHFPQKGHPQKLIKLFSQLHTYHRMLAVAIILATTAMWVEPKMISLLKLYFYPIFTLMTSQMVILLRGAIIKNWSNFFHNSLYILGWCEEQFYGDHVH